MGQILADVPSGLNLTPPQEIKKKGPEKGAMAKMKHLCDCEVMTQL
jgi:hypothetical protein